MLLTYFVALWDMKNPESLATLFVKLVCVCVVFKAGLEDPGCYGNPRARPSLPSILGVVAITTNKSTFLFPTVWRGGDPFKGGRAVLLPSPKESLLHGNQQVKKVLRVQ